MANNKSKREERLQRERLRGYEARKTVHAESVVRRKRDNVTWAVVGVLVVALATFGQIAYLNANAPAPEASASATPSADGVPDPAIAENRTWTGDLVINDVKLGVELDGAAAPQAVASTISLTQKNFYNDTSCHRLTTDGIFVLQCGSPDGTGADGPGYSYGPLENVPADYKYPAGTIAMARGNTPDSQGSQFFIVYEDSQIGSAANGGYTIIGKITSGLDELNKTVTSQGTADGSSDGKPKVPAVIKSFEVK